MPLRLKIINPERTTWTDLARDELSAGSAVLDDFVLIKSDGYPTYNLAHIIDDLEMGVTHIMRSDEFISSMPKFLALYSALGITRPEFVTLPPIMGAEGTKKLGKRDGAKDILDYRDEGYLPQAMMNFLVLIGWNPGTEQEVFTESEFIQAFDISHIHKSGGQYNEEKLDWLNREHLKKLSYEEQEEYIENFIPSEIKNMPTYSNTIVHNITPIVLERISKGSDVIKMAEEGDLIYYFGKPIYEKDALFFKSSKISAENKYTILANYLTQAISLIESIPDSDFSKEKVKETLWPYAEEVGRGDILWPMRYALSGRDKSPDPFILAEILGRDETISRIKTAISILGQ